MSGPLRDDTCLYFAYGSNLCTAQMAERCPSGQIFARALLPGHALVFPRRSERRNCGVAGIVPCPGRVVWGAVYRLTADDIARLDRNEGHIPGRDPAANAYNKRDIAVLRDGARDDIIRAFTYIAVTMPGRHIPSAEYRGLMLRGACEHGLPSDYLAALGDRNSIVESVSYGFFAKVLVNRSSFSNRFSLFASRQIVNYVFTCGPREGD